MRIHVTKTRLWGGGLYYALAETDVFETTFTGAMQLSWTACGDDGSVAMAASHDVRYGASPITTEGGFQSATSVTGEPSPQAAGALQSFLVNWLSSGTYCLAIKTTDDAANVSGLSNSARVSIP